MKIGSVYGPRADHSQIELIAARLDEPAVSTYVDMLQALPPGEAAFYQHECNVVSTEVRSEVIQTELEAQYGFLGGAHSEWIAYLQRPDLPINMWVYLLPEQVRARAGISAVLKKDGYHQRKLVMCCSANYMFCDVRQRQDLGMTAGGALSRMRTATALSAAT